MTEQAVPKLPQAHLRRLAKSALNEDRAWRDVTTAALVPPEQKGLSAAEIRRRMIEGERWEHLVPKSVAGLMKQWKIKERLKGMVKS